MAVSIKNIVPRQLLPSSNTILYTANGVTTVIDKFTATNNSGGAATLTVNLPPPAGSVSTANCVLAAKTIQVGETYTCPELVGQVVAPGGTIVAISGTSNALTISVSGREIS